MEDSKNNRQAIGHYGEDLACEFLISHGHIILERNWRFGHLEIDIISCDPEGIHFVEVKTRKTNIQAPPQNNVDIMKQKRIAKAAAWYLKTSKKIPSGVGECIFDIFAVTFCKENVKTEWFPQAFIPLYF